MLDPELALIGLPREAIEGGLDTSVNYDSDLSNQRTANYLMFRKDKKVKIIVQASDGDLICPYEFEDPMKYIPGIGTGPCTGNCTWEWEYLPLIGTAWVNTIDGCSLKCHCLYPANNGTNIGETITTYCFS